MAICGDGTLCQAVLGEVNEDIGWRTCIMIDIINEELSQVSSEEDSKFHPSSKLKDNVARIVRLN